MLALSPHYPRSIVHVAQNTFRYVQRTIMTRPYPAKARQRRLLLLTFDAFSTLFHPRRPVAELYASVAHSFALSPTVITPAKLQTTFKEAFKAQSKRFPNYGREEVLRGRYGGPRQWWSEVIQASFARAIGGEVQQLPDGMTEYLLDLFASQKGYTLYEDVAPLFQNLKDLKRRGLFDRIVTGVISNSDDRVPSVLKSLGLKVGDVRADRDRSSMELPGFEEREKTIAATGQVRSSPSDNDVDMIITSYEAGEEKPHRLIFDVAKQQANGFVETLDSAIASDIQDGSARWFWLHIGDDYEKDYKGAVNAGWDSILLSRDSHASENEQSNVHDAKTIASLADLIPELEKYATG